MDLICGISGRVGVRVLFALLIRSSCCSLRCFSISGPIMASITFSMRANSARISVPMVSSISITNIITPAFNYKSLYLLLFLFSTRHPAWTFLWGQFVWTESCIAVLPSSSFAVKLNTNEKVWFKPKLFPKLQPHQSCLLVQHDVSERIARTTWIGCPHQSEIFAFASFCTFPPLFASHPWRNLPTAILRLDQIS